MEENRMNVHRCVCGHMPETTITYRTDALQYTTLCRNCRIVYVNGPSETWAHSVDIWNSYLKEYMKMLVARTLENVPDLRIELRSICEK